MKNKACPNLKCLLLNNHAGSCEEIKPPVFPKEDLCDDCGEPHTEDMNIINGEKVCDICLKERQKDEFVDYHPTHYRDDKGEKDDVKLN